MIQNNGNWNVPEGFSVPEGWERRFEDNQWQQQRQATQARLDYFLPDQRNSVKVGECLAKCALTFQERLPKISFEPERKANIDPRYDVRRPNIYILHDPYFWGYRSYYTPAPSVSLNIGFRPSASRLSYATNSNTTKKSDSNKGKEKLYAALAMIAIAAADAFAIGGAIYLIYKCVRGCLTTRAKVIDFKNVESSLKNATITVEGGDSKKEEAAMSVLAEIGKSARRIIDRQHRFQVLKTVATTICSIAGVGAVHALASSIICSCLSKTITTATSPELISVYKFAAASFTPPILIAIATIFVVGACVYIAARRSNHRSLYEADAKQGIEQFDKLNSFLFEPTAPPPASAASAQPANTEVQQGEPIPADTDVPEHASTELEPTPQEPVEGQLQGKTQPSAPIQQGEA